MREQLKRLAKGSLSPQTINRVLLSFPFLYRSRLVSFESTLVARGGLQDLLSNLQEALTLEGDIIECGCHRCGTSIHMARLLRQKGRQKTIFALDSFAGFDKDEFERERKAGLSTAPDGAFTRTSYEYVVDKLHRLGFSEISPVKGFFSDTLPKLHGRYCLGLIDCDLHDSMTFCAETLWPRLASGGRLLFDDYDNERYRGARTAVDAFVARHTGEMAQHGLLRRLYRVVKA